MKCLARPVLVAAALAVALAAAAPAAAQEPRPLSLEQAVAVARENNPAYRKALAEVQTAAAEQRAGWGAFLPDASLSLSTSGSYNRTFSGRNEFGEPVTRDDPLESRNSSSSQSLSVRDITLFDGGAKLHEYRASRASRTAAEARAQATELRVRGEVARRYYRAWQTGEAIRLEERMLEVAREQMEITRGLLRVAQSDPVELLGAELKVAEQEQALEAARGEHRKALLELREQMGLIEDVPLALSDPPPAPWDPTALQPAVLVARALESNPRLDDRQAATRAATSQLRAARAGRLPSLSMALSAGRNQYFQGLDGLRETSPQDQSVGVSFSLSLPLFDQFRTSVAVARARAGLHSAEADARAERLLVEKEVREALIELENAYRAARNAERTLALGRERLSLALEQYRLGAKSFTDLQPIVQDAARAERDALKMRHDFAAALATLEERVAAPVRP